jgi:hypothetical protein
LAADAANALHAVLVADVATQRITRIRRIDDETARANDLDGLPDQPRLGIDRVYLEELAHINTIIL